MPSTRARMAVVGGCTAAVLLGAAGAVAAVRTQDPPSQAMTYALECGTDERVGASSALVDPAYVNGLPLSETLTQYIDSDLFDIDASGLEVDSSQVGRTGGEVYLRDGSGAVRLIVETTKTEAAGWRIGQWVRCS